MTTEKEISVWAKAVFSAMEGKTEKEKEFILNKLIETLKGRKKEHLLPKIFKKFKLLYLKKERIELSFAMEHPLVFTEKIKEELLGFFGKEKSVSVKTEKDLIGGFRAKTEKILIKASIKDFLTELKNNELKTNV